MLKALIIDDSKISQNLISKSLKDLDLVFEYANDGEEALKILSRMTFDFIITDLSMPNMDGDKLLEIVRKEDHSTPIYVITSGPNKDLEDDLILKGADAVYNKMEIVEFREFISEKISTAMKVVS